MARGRRHVCSVLCPVGDRSQSAQPPIRCFCLQEAVTTRWSILSSPRVQATESAVCECQSEL